MKEKLLFDLEEQSAYQASCSYTIHIQLMYLCQLLRHWWQVKYKSIWLNGNSMCQCVPWLAGCWQEVRIYCSVCFLNLHQQASCAATDGGGGESFKRAGLCRQVTLEHRPDSKCYVSFHGRSLLPGYWHLNVNFKTLAVLLKNKPELPPCCFGAWSRSHA